MRLSDSNMRLSEQQSHSGSHGMDRESLKITVPSFAYVSSPAPAALHGEEVGGAV